MSCMNRPGGLLLTTWMMVALMVVGWVLGSRHHTQLNSPSSHLNAFTTILMLVVNVIAFVCIFYYFQGRNWARIAVLLTSILSILSFPFQFRHQDTPGRVVSAVWVLLGIFFLYWLNTRSLREFFKRTAPSG
jgi:drug/metabolite transporter (DMT)-like permease